MADSEIPPLEDQLCFDLYVASRAVTQAYRPVLGELGLTYPQYLVLIVLWTERKATVGHLADVLRLERNPDALTAADGDQRRRDQAAWEFG